MLIFFPNACFFLAFRKGSKFSGELVDFFFNPPLNPFGCSFFFPFMRKKGLFGIIYFSVSMQASLAVILFDKLS